MKYIYKPLKRILPVTVALLFTFIFCGLLHDAVTTIYRGGNLGFISSHTINLFSLAFYLNLVALDKLK